MAQDILFSIAILDAIFRDARSRTFVPSFEMQVSPNAPSSEGLSLHRGRARQVDSFDRADCPQSQFCKPESVSLPA